MFHGDTWEAGTAGAKYVRFIGMCKRTVPFRGLSQKYVRCIGVVICILMGREIRSARGKYVRRIGMDV